MFKDVGVRHKAGRSQNWEDAGPIEANKLSIAAGPVVDDFIKSVWR
jgi:hypothetical protein